MKWLKFGALGLLGIVALAIVTLLILGRRDSAGVMTATIDIARPPAEVWSWLEDKDRFKQWVSWTVDVKDEGPSGIGGKRRTFMKDPNMGGEIVVIDSVIREYTPHKSLDIHLSSPMGFDGDMRYKLDDLGGSTRLAIAGKFKYDHWLANLMEPLVTPQASDKLLTDLATLKRLAEAAGR